MKIAYIIADKDDSVATGKLEKHLVDNNIEPIVMGFIDFMSGIYHRRLEKGLYYRNPYVRIESPKATLDFFLNLEFDALYYKNNLEFLALDPQKAMTEHSRFYMPKIHNNFVVQSDHGTGTQTTVDDESPYPTILMYTHSRAAYFEMTFNSLIHSLGGDRKYPIKVLVNGEENLNFVASHIGSRYTQYDIEILLCRENAYLGSCHAMLKYFDYLDDFIVMEDDIILPQLLSYHIPHWPKQFINRLKIGYDVVGMAAETYNRPLDHVWPSPPLSNQGGWYYGGPGDILPIMGQCISTTRKNYLKNIDPNNFCASDEKLLKKSTRHCAPWMRPYHIGFNAKIDYIKKVDYKKAPSVVTIESLRTGVIKTIDLKV